MRPIKFRVVDLKTKKVIYYSDECCLGNAIDHYEGDPDNTLLQQFTGLLDKNGEEIYEGDILRYNYQLNEPGRKDTDFFGEVIYDSRAIRCSELDAYHVGFILRGYDETFEEYWYTDMPDMEDVEVIGNIYENPELLGGDHGEKNTLDRRFGTHA
jgi:uncharacterized phage protein (TIGR01671 family)